MVISPLQKARHPMRLICNLLIFTSLCVFTLKTQAQNSDILWQKTLTADSLPIRSIAIAEGKYVAALKGNQIVILDYASGDSIRSFTTPKEMYGSDIVLGKGGERVYVLSYYPCNNCPTGICGLVSWDIRTGVQTTDTLYLYEFIQSIEAYQDNGKSFSLSASLDARFIAVGFSYSYYNQKGGDFYRGSDSRMVVINTITGGKVFGSSKKEDAPLPTAPGAVSKSPEQILVSGNSYSFAFSPSGRYFQNNRTYSLIHEFHNITKTDKIEYGNITSLDSTLASYSFPYIVPPCIISSGDDFLLDGMLLKDIPRTYTFRSINKPGFVFLPDDNHMLAFQSGGGVAAISNIQQDTWEKVYQGDSLTENIIQTNASRSAFATATNDRITLWKVPTDLQPADLKANFTILKDSLLIGDTAFCSNSTFPFKRGIHYKWDMGDGTSSSVVNPYHKYSKDGIYTITLEASDTLGRVSVISKKVVVQGFRAPSGAVWVNRITSNRVNCLAYSPNGDIIVSGSDSAARTWTSNNGNLSKSVQYTTNVFNTTFTKNGDSVIVGSISNKKALMNSSNYADRFTNYTSIWDLNSNKSTVRLSWSVFGGYNSPPYMFIRSIAACSDVSLDFNYYLTGHRVFADWSTTVPENVGRDFDKYLRMNDHIGNYIYYNFTTNKSSIKPVFSFYTPMYALKIAPNSRHYASILETKPDSPTLFLKDILTDSILRQIPTTATAMRFSPDKYHLLTSTALWDVYDSVMVQAVTLPQVFEYHQDGIHVFTIRPDSTIGIYNLHSNSYEYIYPKQPNAFTCLAVAPDGKHIATGDINGFITVWKVPDSLKTTVKADFTTVMTKRSGVKTTDTVDFFNTTLPASDNSLYYFWDFGDGTTSNETSPKHRYSPPGTYTVTLTVFQYGKIMDTMVKAQYITVTAPIAADDAQTGIYENSVSIQPNPSYGEARIRLTFAQAGEYTLHITDNLGREIARWAGIHAAGEENIVWNSDVSSGVYYGVFSADGIVKTVPIVVVR